MSRQGGVWTLERRQRQGQIMRARMRKLALARRNFHFNNIQRAIERVQQELDVLKQAETITQRYTTKEAE